MPSLEHVVLHLNKNIKLKTSWLRSHQQESPNFTIKLILIVSSYRLYNSISEILVLMEIKSCDGEKSKFLTLGKIAFPGL